MKKTVISIITGVMLATMIITTSFAIESIWQDNNIIGKVMKISKQHDVEYILIKTDSKFVWVVTQSKKSYHLKTNNIYEFYPPYLVEENAKVPGDDNNRYLVMYSIGLVDKSVQLNKYAFRGIIIGNSMTDTYDRLVKLGYQPKYHKPSEGNSPADILISKVNINGFTVDLEFNGDFHNKLASYDFRITGADNIADSKWIQEKTTFLHNMLKKDYGVSMVKSSKMREMKDKIVKYAYTWSNGDININIIEQHTVGTVDIIGTVASGTRSAQTYNYLVGIIKKKMNEPME